MRAEVTGRVSVGGGRVTRRLIVRVRAAGRVSVKIASRVGA